MERMESLGLRPPIANEPVVSFCSFVPDFAATACMDSNNGPLLEQTSSFFNIGEDPFASMPPPSSYKPQEEQPGPFQHSLTSSSEVQRVIEELASAYASSAQAVVDAEDSSPVKPMPEEPVLFEVPTLTDGLAAGVSNHLADSQAGTGSTGNDDSGPEQPQAHASSSTPVGRRTLGDGPFATGHLPAIAEAPAASDGRLHITAGADGVHISYSAPNGALASVPEIAEERSLGRLLSLSSGTEQPSSTLQEQPKLGLAFGARPATATSTGIPSSSTRQEGMPPRPPISVDPAPSAPAVLSPSEARSHAPRSRRPSDGSRPSGRHRRRSTGEMSLPSYHRLSGDGLHSPSSRSSSRRATLDDAGRHVAELGFAPAGAVGVTGTTRHGSHSSPRRSPRAPTVLVPGGLSLEAIEAALGSGSSTSEPGSTRPPAEGGGHRWADAGRHLDQSGVLAAAMAAMQGAGGGGAGSSGVPPDAVPRSRRSTRDIKNAFDTMQAHIAKLEMTNCELQERIIMVQTALAESQGALAEAQTEGIEAVASKQRLEEQIRHLTAKVKGSEHQVEFLAKQLDAQQQHLRQSADALASKAGAVSVLESEIATLKERIAELQRELEAGKRKVAYEGEEARRAAAEAAAARRDSQGLQEALAKARTEAAELRESLGSARAEAMELREKLSGSQAEMARRVAELSGQCGGLHEQLQDMRHVATGLEAKNAQLEATNAQLGAQLAASEGAKAVLRQQLEAARAALTAANAAAAATAASAYAPVGPASPPPTTPYHSSYTAGGAAWQSYNPPPPQQQQQQRQEQYPGAPPVRPGDYAIHANGYSSTAYGGYRLPDPAPSRYSQASPSFEQPSSWQQREQQPSPTPAYGQAGAAYYPQPQQYQVQQPYASPPVQPSAYAAQQQQPPSPAYQAQQPAAGRRSAGGAAADPLSRSYDTPPWFAPASRPADVRSSLQFQPQQGPTAPAASTSGAAPPTWEQLAYQPPAQWVPPGQSQSWHRPGMAAPSYNPVAAAAPGSAYSASAAEHSPPERAGGPTGPSPFGTDLTLSELMANTKQLEDALMLLSRERDELESEYAKMPLHGGRTLRERQRKAEVEARLEQLRKEISNVRLQLKRLGH